MKKIALIVFILTLTAGSILSLKSSFGKFNFNLSNKVQGSGSSKTENRNLSGFDEISAGGAINLEVSVQKEFSVEVEADDNLLQYIKTEVNGDTLKIYTEGKISTKSRINVRVSMPALNGVDISGASTANISNVKSESIKLEASGASKIKVNGEAKILESEVSGASNIDAEDLKVENADVEANGASKMVVSASNELKADASGASSISYTGDPKNVSTKNSGASSVKKR